MEQKLTTTNTNNDEPENDKKYRNYCFTLNNYQTHMDGMLIPPPGEGPDGSPINIYLYTLVMRLTSVKYMIIGFEVGSVCKTPHIQGYVEFNNPRSFSAIRKIIPQISWRIRRGTPAQASEYCKKDGDFHEWGEISKQGQRNDLNILKDNIISGTPVEKIVIDDPVAYHQYGRTLNKIEDLVMRKKFRMNVMTTCTWYWGPTGVGKSHKAFENYSPDTHYLLPNDNGWWDAYTQQDTVIINDFRGEIPYNEMLQMIDCWPYSVKRRNREPMPFISKNVIITSSLPPEEVYCKRNERDKISQLLRRIEVVLVTPERNGTEVPGGGNTRPPRH